MFFSRYITICPNGVTPQRLAAAKGKITKRKKELQRRNESVALFPELQAPLPDFDPISEIEKQDQRLVEFQIDDRLKVAAAWRAHRRILFGLDPVMRRRVIAYWNLRIYPGTPEYFITILKGVVSGRINPEEEAALKALLAKRGADPEFRRRLGEAVDKVVAESRARRDRIQTEDQKSEMKNFHLE